MAYSTTNPAKKILDLGFASTLGGAVYVYESTHAHGAVEAANFFIGCGFASPTAAAIGMRVGDLVAVLAVSTAGTSAFTWHRVSSLSTSTGFGGGIHATVSAASS